MTKIDFQNFDRDFFRGFSDFPIEIAKISKNPDISIEFFIEKIIRAEKTIENDTKRARNEL